MKGLTTSRHDLLVQIVAKFARQAGLWVKVEPRDGSTKRPDVYIYSPTKMFAVDYSVTNPSAKSYRSAASVKALAAAETRENRKISSYRGMQHGMILIPFVHETYGALGKLATRFVKELARMAQESPTYQGKGNQWRTIFLQAMSFALRANAWILRMGSSRANGGLI